MPTQPALPQNYILDEGTLLEGFENATDWTIQEAQNGGTWVNDPNVFKLGNQSIRCTAINGYVSVNKPITPRVMNPKVIGIWVYLHTDQSTFSNIDIRLSSISTVNKFIRAQINYAVGGVFPASRIAEGWNFLTFHRDEFININGESWANPMIRLKLVVTSAGGKTAIVSIDSLYFDFECLPARCLLTFDDARNTDIDDRCFKYMNDRGIRGTVYVISGNVGVSDTMTVDQLDTLYAAGWALGNHTSGHNHMASLSLADATARLRECTDWLLQHDYKRAAYHHAYPFGEYNDTAQAALASAGMLTGRTTNYSLQSTPPGNLYTLQIWDAGTANHTLAQAKTVIDMAMRYQKTVIFMFHHLVVSNPGSEEWTYADFQALIDYIVACRIKCVTIDEWYNGLTNPRYGALPPSRLDIA